MTNLPENQVLPERDHKTLESELSRQARVRGLLLRRNPSRDPSAEGYGLYVLIADCPSNHLPDSKVTSRAFLRGEGQTLDGIADDLAKCW